MERILPPMATSRVPAWLAAAIGIAAVAVLAITRDDPTQVRSLAVAEHAGAALLQDELSAPGPALDPLAPIRPLDTLAPIEPVELGSRREPIPGTAFEERATPNASFATLRVRVVDGDGRPASGMRVRYRLVSEEEEPLDAPAVSLGYSWKDTKERTDEHGVLVLDGVGVDTWRVAAGDPPDWGYAFSDPIVLAAGDSADVEIAVAPLPRDRAIEGIVLDPTGAPVRGALVEYAWTRPTGKHDRIYVHPRSDGRFGLLPPADARGGALRSSVYKSRLRSASLASIDAGTVGHTLNMGAPVFVELDVRGPDDRALDAFQARFEYELAGQWVHDYPGPSKRPGEPLVWGLPTVPFRVHVSAGRTYLSQSVGPLDPDSVAPTFVVYLERRIHTSGRVVFDGVPVAEATVQAFASDVTVEAAEASRSSPSRLLSSARTNSAGAFSLPLSTAASVRLVAWSRHHGGGELGPLELGVQEIDGLVIEITRPPASIRGRVSFPRGHGPEEIWLTTENLYTVLFADGRYEFTGLQPGSHTVHVRESFGENPVPGTSFWMSHPPAEPPEWLTTECVYRVDLEAGEAATLDIDLAGRPLCWIEARIEMGEAIPLRGTESGFPRAVLEHADRGGYLSSGRLDSDGRFALGCEEPGDHRLRVGFHLPEGYLEVRDSVAMYPGTGSWTFAPEFGALRILPAKSSDPPHADRGIGLRWQGSSDRVVFVESDDVDESAGTRFFPRVPAGNVEVVRGPRWGEQTLVGRVRVVAGETVAYRMP